jgi:hypothetical protein
MNLKTPLLTTVALAVVAATPAAAHVGHDLPRPSDPAYAVPDGKIEHSVTVTEVTGSQAVARHTRTELWMTRNRARSVTTNVKTGRVTSETVITPTETRTYSAQTRQVTVRKTRRAEIPWRSFLYEMALQRAYVEQGITKVVGETTVRDRRALFVESVPGKWTSDRPDGRTVALIDAETYALYERTSTLPDDTFTQKQTFQTQELLSPSTRVRFAMSKHAGARIRHNSRD